MPSEKLAEAIYRDFVFNELSMDTIAAEKSMPILSARKTLIDYAIRKTHRKVTSFWLVLAIGAPLNVLGFATVMILGLVNEAKGEALFGLGFVSLLVSFFVWAVLVESSGASSDNRILRDISYEFRSISEPELRLRLKAFEIDSNTDFWLSSSTQKLRGCALLKESKVKEEDL